MIEQKIKKWIEDAVGSCRKDGVLSFKGDFEVELTVPRASAFGDFSTNAALIIAAKEGKKPREVAAAITEHMPGDILELEKVEVAGPGFINFTVRPLLYLEGLSDIYNEAEDFGRVKKDKRRKVQIEFVSANPTGPLHIGHGRGAVYGDVLANIFTALGHETEKEYYVNDAGGQIKTLGRSVYLRLRELEGEKIEYPAECYQGSYICEIAKELKRKKYAKIASLNEDEAVEFMGEYAGTKILGEIKKDLAETGVIHDIYFHENRLHSDALVDSAINKLREKGHIFDEDGAVWFRSTSFGDDKDRVLKKSDGSLTYFAADIAYHKNKFERGFDRVIDVWGADHAGYVARMKAAVAALGYDPASFDAVLIQLVNLMKGGEAVSMSTRHATYETLEDVRNDVGRDVCRYFFLMRSHNAQLDFDLELAKKQTPDNPVFYVQYAHARISSIFKKAAENKMKPANPKNADLGLLDLPEEPKIARMLCEYPAILQECADELEPHKLAFYLLELARMFQSYYSMGRRDARYMVVSNDIEKTRTKLYFLKNIQIVLQNALRTLGLGAPDHMENEEEMDNA